LQLQENILLALEGDPKKPRPLRLTANIFKKPEPICMILAHFNAVLCWTHL